MSSDMFSAMAVSASGMKAQGARVRVIAENVANADTTGKTAGSDPYRRQTISFSNELDKQLGVDLVKVDRIGVDKDAQFTLQYMPDHPAADASGYVKMPNVNMLIEMMDMREAQRSYEANLGLIEQARSMILRTIDLLRT
ncbi:MAG: flagellar basal body rod protein FlgC [Rhodospirillales bacterium]|nr:flagellar basal body rod protein FlgC [Alphaproteobacteria bacterium]MCB1839252.1 flagellar basal body rod protein FlgC [Alphaproteobacteria bacterium]MCB9976185.1 flagellar basal body rod protein FlgC [Rhodospirillales bacterium]